MSVEFQHRFDTWNGESERLYRLWMSDEKKKWNSDKMMRTFMQSTQDELDNMYSRITIELQQWDGNTPMRTIQSRNGVLHFYPEDGARLCETKWLSNANLEVFVYKILFMLRESSTRPNIFNEIKMLSPAFLYMMGERGQGVSEYSFENCRRHVPRIVHDRKKGTYTSLLSYGQIIVPSHAGGETWCLFIIVPPDRSIKCIDFMNDATSPYHINIYNKLVRFMVDYEVSAGIETDKWAWNYKPMKVMKSIGINDSGVGVCLAIYCSIMGLDYSTISGVLLKYEARIMIFYISMGWVYDQNEEEYNTMDDEERGHITMLETNDYFLDYNHDASKAGRQERYVGVNFNPPTMQQTTLNDLVFPDS
jgi:hypothetical protein